MNDKIRELAHDLNADSVKRGVNYKGYKVYEPVYNKVTYIGYPYVIFESDKEIRLSTEQESIDYIEYKNNHLGD